MSDGPFVVVCPDGAGVDRLLAETGFAMEGLEVERLAPASRTLAANRVYFLAWPLHALLSDLRIDFSAASLLVLGERADLPAEAEVFVLKAEDDAAVVPLLRALVRRRCACCRGLRAFDDAAATVSRALVAETADLSRVLSTLGPAVAAQRVTLCELRDDGLAADATHEWCAAGAEWLVRPQPVLDRRTLAWLLPQLESKHLVRIDDIGALPFTAIAERVLVERRGAQALLIAPVGSPRGAFRGLLVAEQTERGEPWNRQAERLLLLSGEMLANYLDRKSARAEAQERESVHRQLLEHIPDGLFMSAADGSRALYVTPTAARMWGMPEEELTAGPDHWQWVVHPHDLPRVRAQTRAGPERLADGEEAMEFRILRADDGEERWIRSRSFPVRSVDGRVDRVARLMEDVTAKREQEARMRLLARVFETTGEAVMITDPESRIVDVNPAFTRITGYSREEVLGCNPRVMASGRHGKAFYGEMWHSLLTRHHWHGEIWDRRRDGAEYAKLLTINAITEADGTISSYVGIFADITEVKETEARLERLAHHDALTGLPNRVLFRDRLEQALANAARAGELLGVMFLDLDGFKEINDRLGHRAGDQLLVEVAQRLRDQVRESDTLARLGGDEFTALLPRLADRRGAAAVADKFLAALARPFEIMGSSVEVSASIGISLFPEHAADADGLLRSADGAMYQAKDGGRNRRCFAAA